jgi:hypothetical protein
MRKLIYKVTKMVTYAVVISLMTLALSGIAWAIFTLFTGGFANADYGIYR